MRRTIFAAGAYFAIVFACGFVLGAVRLMAIAPRTGPTTAVLLELPLMLAASWLSCGWSIRAFEVPRGLGARLAMGAIAFGLLLAAEAALGVLGFGQTLGAWIAAFGAPPGLVGLAGQIAFALVPVAQRARPRP
jgi:hypothetical protein